MTFDDWVIVGIGIIAAVAMYGGMLQILDTWEIK